MKTECDLLAFVFPSGQALQIGLDFDDRDLFHRLSKKDFSLEIALGRSCSGIFGLRKHAK